MNLPTAQQFCKCAFDGPDGTKCTTEWRRMFFPANERTDSRFNAAWVRHADELGVPHPKETIERRNDHPDTTFAQLAECFARTVREMERP